MISLSRLRRNVRVSLIASFLALFLPGVCAASFGSVDKIVSKKAGVLELLHRKAKKAIVTAAQDRTFPDYFDAHDHNHEHIHDHTHAHHGHSTVHTCCNSRKIARNRCKFSHFCSRVATNSW